MPKGWPGIPPSLAGLTEDQEELLEEILEPPYFRDDPGVLWRLSPSWVHPGSGYF